EGGRDQGVGCSPGTVELDNRDIRVGVGGGAHVGGAIGVDEHRHVAGILPQRAVAESDGEVATGGDLGQEQLRLVVVGSVLTVRGDDDLAGGGVEVRGETFELGVLERGQRPRCSEGAPVAGGRFGDRGGATLAGC